jgi:hypothetical protein
MQANQNTPEITMNEARDLQENEENNRSEDEAIENNTGTAANEATRPANIARYGPDLTIDDVTRLVQHHNLPEAVVSDIRNFQQVFSKDSAKTKLTVDTAAPLCSNDSHLPCFARNPLIHNHVTTTR